MQPHTAPRPFYNEDDYGFNQFSAADNQHSHEVDAYKFLKEHHGNEVPRYYGSYSLSLSIDPERRRTVRLILIDFVEGTTMSKVNPTYHSRPAREKLVKRIIDV